MEGEEKFKPGRFFFRGKFFDDEGEFFEYVKNYNEHEMDLSSFEDIMHFMKKDIWINYEIFGRKITNRDFQEIISSAVLDVIGKIKIKKPDNF